MSSFRAEGGFAAQGIGQQRLGILQSRYGRVQLRSRQFPVFSYQLLPTMEN
ncbi:MAG: hypothetical protein ABI690_10270 [Chloroflexota bacterium]